MYFTKKKIAIIAYCLWLLALRSVVFASNSAESCNIPITQFEILRDSDNNLLPREVVNSTKFTKQSILNFGYTQAAYWVRFPLKYSFSGKKIFAVSQIRTIDFIDFYLVRNGQIIDSQKTGFLRPLKTRQKLITRFVFMLPSQPSENDMLYVKIRKQEGKLSTEFIIEDETTLTANDDTERQTIFFFLGVGFLMIMFAFAYFISFKLKMFLWYAVFLLSFLLHQVTDFGYGTLYLWSDWAWFSNIAKSAWNVPTLFAVLMFSFQLLHVKEFCSSKTVKLFRRLKLVVLLQLPFPFIEIPTYPWHFVMYSIHCVTIALILVMITYASWKAIRRKYLPGYLFMAGEITLFAISTLMLIRNFNIIYVFIPDFIMLYAGMTAMLLAMFSMIVYTRKEYVTIVRELVETPKPEPKQLTEEELEKLQNIILKTEAFFQLEPPYLNPDFCIKHLAEQMNIPEHLLSKSINVKAGMHFFDFVNSFRIKEAIILLSDEKAMKKYTIESLARQCGFGNKASFYKAFKKTTGKTPSDFQQKTIIIPDRLQ